MVFVRTVREKRKIVFNKGSWRMRKVIQRRANNGKENIKENKYTQNPEEMLETDLEGRRRQFKRRIKRTNDSVGRIQKRKDRRRKF